MGINRRLALEGYGSHDGGVLQLFDDVTQSPWSLDLTTQGNENGMDDVLIVGDYAITVTTAGFYYHIHCIDLVNRTKLWTQTYTGFRPLSNPVSDGTYVWFMDYTSTLHRYQLNDGSVGPTYTLGQTELNPIRLILSGDTFIIGLNNSVQFRKKADFAPSIATVAQGADYGLAMAEGRLIATSKGNRETTAFLLPLKRSCSAPRSGNLDSPAR